MRASVATIQQMEPRTQYTKYFCVSFFKLVTSSKHYVFYIYYIAFANTTISNVQLNKQPVLDVLYPLP